MNNWSDVIYKKEEKPKRIEVPPTYFDSLMKHYWECVEETSSMAFYIVYLEKMLKENNVSFNKREFERVEDIKEWVNEIESEVRTLI